MQKLNQLYTEIVALEFGENPAKLAQEVQESSLEDDWVKEYHKVKDLRPVITRDKKTKHLKVTGLTGLK